MNRPMRSKNGQFIVREDIVLASAAARPATLLLASTTLPALQDRGPPRHPPETPPEDEVIKSDARIASAIVNVRESAGCGAEKKT